MTRPHIETYARELGFLDAALVNRGCVIPFESYGKAVAYRHKLYRARRRYYETTQRPSYNDLIIKLRHADEYLPAIVPAASKPDGTVEIVILDRDIAAPMPLAYDLDGRPILTNSPTAEDLTPAAFMPLDPSIPLTEEMDLLEQAAADIMRKIRAENPGE